MWELRLILILIGAVIVTGVYLLSRQHRSGKQKPGTAFQRKSPVLDRAVDPEAVGDDFSLPDEPDLQQDGETVADPPVRTIGDQQLILALHVAAREGIVFEGARTLEILTAAGLKYGRYHIFHRLLKNNPDLSVFSVANMVEPGTFDLDSMRQQNFPGLTLFLVLPGPQDGVAAYADMLATARNLAQRLGGDVLDETRSTLTRQTAHHIRERIIEFQRRSQLSKHN